MNTQKAIVYDDTCPMCRWYTKAFVNAGLLEEDGRVSFSELDDRELIQCMDLERSRDEIPLLDREGGPTLYGIDSLVYLLGDKLPIIPRLMKYRSVDWLVRRFYKLVSYNRRVIAPSRSEPGKIDCTPHFDYRYRMIYVFLATSFGLLVLTRFWVWSLLCWILLLLPALALRRERLVEYLGQYSTVVMLGGLLLLPSIWVPFLSTGLMILAGLVMLWQLFRRAGLFYA